MVEFIDNERYFNNNDLLWDIKYSKIIRVWFFIFVVICIFNEYLYYKNFHDNDAILIIIPFCHIPFTWIFYFLKEFINIPHGDKEYILNYYPEIYKKLFFPNYYGEYSTKWTRYRFGFTLFNFINGDYINDEEDEIIDEIRDRWDNQIKILYTPLIILIIFVILTIINIGLKHGLG